MNLLDEKLKKKLKLFENIDNEFGKEVKLNNKKPKKKKQKNNLPISNLTSEQFDKIYTNFLLDSNKIKINHQRQQIIIILIKIHLKI